eukprot:s510_g10.t1
MATDGQHQMAELIQAVQQLRQEVTAGQQRENQLRAQVETLTNQQQTQAEHLAAQQQQAQQAQPLPGLPADVGLAFTALATSQRELVESLKSKDRKLSLVDNKGLAKPERFSGKEEQFLYWRTRVEAFITSVFPELEDVMLWAEEFDGVITGADVRAAWGAANPTHETVDDVESKSTQVYAVLQTLCEGEAFTIARSAGKHNGFDAWRRLVRRYDPTTGGRRRTMLRHILNPNKVNKLEELSNAIEQWEEQLRLYENRKRSDGTRHQLDEEIRISVLEHLCPTELERHLQLNRSRYNTYQDVREEVSLYLETRLGARLKIGDASHPGDESVPMDIGAFGKGKKGKGKSKSKDSKGKGKGGKGKGKTSASSSGKGGKKEDRKCHNCGKVGHLVKDCWAAGGGQANTPKDGKGKGKGGKSKGVGNLEEGATEPEAEKAAETGFLSIAGLEEVKTEWIEEPELITVDADDDCVQVKCEDADRCVECCSLLPLFKV